MLQHDPPVHGFCSRRWRQPRSRTLFEVCWMLLPLPCEFIGSAGGSSVSLVKYEWLSENSLQSRERGSIFGRVRNSSPFGRNNLLPRLPDIQSPKILESRDADLLMMQPANAFGCEVGRVTLSKVIGVEPPHYER